MGKKLLTFFSLIILFFGCSSNKKEFSVSKVVNPEYSIESFRIDEYFYETDHNFGLRKAKYKNRTVFYTMNFYRKDLILNALDINTGEVFSVFFETDGPEAYPHPSHFFGLIDTILIASRLTSNDFHIFTIDLENKKAKKLKHFKTSSDFIGPPGVSFSNDTKLESHLIQSFENGALINIIPYYFNMEESFYERPAFFHLDFRNFILTPSQIFPRDRRKQFDISNFPYYYFTYALFDQTYKKWFVASDFSDSIQIFQQYDFTQTLKLVNEVSFFSRETDFNPTKTPVTYEEMNNLNTDLMLNYMASAKYFPIYLKEDRSCIYRIMQTNITNIGSTKMYNKYLLEYSLPDLELTNMYLIPNFASNAVLEHKGKYYFQINDPNQLTEGELKFLVINTNKQH